MDAFVSHHKASLILFNIMFAKYNACVKVTSNVNTEEMGIHKYYCPNPRSMTNIMPFLTISQLSVTQTWLLTDTFYPPAKNRSNIFLLRQSFASGLLTCSNIPGSPLLLRTELTRPNTRLQARTAVDRWPSKL